jgi:hypothetical protein
MKTWQANLVATGSTTSRLTGTVALSPTDAGSYNVTVDFRGGPKQQ